MLLAADFSWPQVAAPVEQDGRSDHVAACFDEDLFATRLAAYVSACSHHNESLDSKIHKEHAAQTQVRRFSLSFPVMLTSWPTPTV